jgi:hypothetical protein
MPSSRVSSRHPARALFVPAPQRSDREEFGLHFMWVKALVTNIGDE